MKAHPRLRAPGGGTHGRRQVRKFARVLAQADGRCNEVVRRGCAPGQPAPQPGRSEAAPTGSGEGGVLAQGTPVVVRTGPARESSRGSSGPRCAIVAASAAAVLAPRGLRRRIVRLLEPVAQLLLADDPLVLGRRTLCSHKSVGRCAVLRESGACDGASFTNCLLVCERRGNESASMMQSSHAQYFTSIYPRAVVDGENTCAYPLLCKTIVVIRGISDDRYC